MSLKVVPGSPPPMPPTARGRKRREGLLDAAEELFASNGFHATGIDDIGNAAGITGPGIYRHFDGKDAILVAVLDRVWFLLRASLEELSELPPREALNTLVDRYLDLAVHHPGAVLVLLRELRHAPEEYQRRAAANDAKMLDVWATLLVAVSPGRTLDEARVATRGLHWLVLSLGQGVPLDPADRRAIVSAMVKGAIDAF